MMQTCCNLNRKTPFGNKSLFMSPLHLLLIFFLLQSWLVTSCDKPKRSSKKEQKTYSSQVAPKHVTSIVSIILPLSEIISSKEQSLESVLRILGIQSIKLKDGNILTLEGPGYNAQMQLQKMHGALLVSVFMIHIDSSLNLQFKDITTVLGKWKLISESKESSVLFLHKNPRTHEIASIYVHLLDPPRYPTSRVLSIWIRRGAPPTDS